MRFAVNLGPRIFKKISQPQNISFEIARDRIEIPADWWCATSPRPADVPKHCAERRHTAARRNSSRFGPKILEIFRGQNFFHPKSCGIAPKSLPIGCAQPRHDPQRSPSTVPCVGTMRHVRFRAILSGFPTEIFEKFSRPRNFRARSRRNACCPTTRSLATTCRGPQALCHASARCGT